MIRLNGKVDLKLHLPCLLALNSIPHMAWRRMARKCMCHTGWDLAIALHCPDVNMIICCPHQVKKKKEPSRVTVESPESTQTNGGHFGKVIGFWLPWMPTVLMYTRTCTCTYMLKDRKVRWNKRPSIYLGSFSSLKNLLFLRQSPIYKMMMNSWNQSCLAYDY